jgi:hypothetical protein
VGGTVGLIPELITQSFVDCLNWVCEEKIRAQLQQKLPSLLCNLT